MFFLWQWSDNTWHLFCFCTAFTIILWRLLFNVCSERNGWIRPERRYDRKYYQIITGLLLARDISWNVSNSRLFLLLSLEFDGMVCYFRYIGGLFFHKLYTKNATHFYLWFRFNSLETISLLERQYIYTVDCCKTFSIWSVDALIFVFVFVPHKVHSMNLIHKMKTFTSIHLFSTTYRLKVKVTHFNYWSWFVIWLIRLKLWNEKFMMNSRFNFVFQEVFFWQEQNTEILK